MVVYIELFPYLFEWLKYQTGATTDEIRFPKNWEEERHLLRQSLQLLPEGVAPETANSPAPHLGRVKVPLHLPENKEKPPLSYFYICDAVKRSLEALIAAQFRADLWKYLHLHGRIYGEKISLVYAFLETRGMSSVHVDTVLKIYQRQRRRHRNSKNPKFF